MIYVIRDIKARRIWCLGNISRKKTISIPKVTWDPKLNRKLIDIKILFNIVFYGKISVRIKIGIPFIFRFHRHPIQIVVFFPVGLLSFSTGLCRRNLDTQQRPVENVVITMKGLQERTQLFEWDDGEA